MALAVPVISASVAYGVSNGIARARINGLMDRIALLEDSRFITRVEYEARQSELREVWRENHKQTIEVINAMRKT